MPSWSFAVDCLAIIFIAFNGWRGYRMGLLAALANIGGLIISLILAYLTYQLVANWLNSLWPLPHGILQVFSFLLIAFAIDTLFTGLIFLASKKWTVHLVWWLKPLWAAGLLGVVNGVITVTYIFSIVSALPLEHPIKTTVTKSLITRPLLHLHQQIGSPAQQIVGPAISDLSQLFTISPDSKEIVKLNFSSDQAKIVEQFEQQLIDKVNQERTQRGLSTLRFNSHLQQIGRQHSLDMFEQGYFSHYNPAGQDPFDRLKHANYNYLKAGENLALAPTVDQAHQGLMNSPGHRRNILDPDFGQIGIGAYQDPRYGIMFTQLFSD